MMRLLYWLPILVAVWIASATLTPAASAQRPSSTLWAVVDIDGHLAYGSGAVFSQQIGADGTYEVVFDRDVSRCAYVAAAGDYTGDTYSGPDDAITIGAGPRDNNPQAVFLIQYDAILGMDAYSSGFHLIVNC